MKVDTMNFKNIVETINGLPREYKMEIITLLEHNVADSRREEIAANYKKSTIEQKSGKLKFSSKVSELKNALMEFSFSSSFKKAFKKRSKSTKFEPDFLLRFN